MKKFKSLIDREANYESFSSNPGNPIEPIMQWQNDETGKLVYVQVGERNLDEYIQAGRDFTDMAIIIERIKNGETNLLSVNKPNFADTTAFPTDFNTAYQQANAIKGKFEDLDPEIKAVFNNDYETFVDSVLNNTVDTLLNAKKEVKEDVKEQ